MIKPRVFTSFNASEKELLHDDGFTSEISAIRFEDNGDGIKGTVLIPELKSKVRGHIRIVSSNCTMWDTNIDQIEIYRIHVLCGVELEDATEDHVEKYTFTAEKFLETREVNDEFNDI